MNEKVTTTWRIESKYGKRPWIEWCGYSSLSHAEACMNNFRAASPTSKIRIVESVTITKTTEKILSL